MQKSLRFLRYFLYTLTALLWIVWLLIEAFQIEIETPDIFEPAIGVVSGLSILITILWQLDKSEPETRSNREILIDTVQNNWIEGFLKDALRDAQFGIRAETAPQQAADVRNPDYQITYPQLEIPEETRISKMLRFVLRKDTDRTHDEILQNTAEVIPQIFDHVDRKLLILGAPGSGKTILMLQLAEQLLEKAREGSISVPVVFNLSSWAQERKSLRDWIIDELKRNYGVVSKKLAEQWINGDNLIYLLDGLDEVAEAYRDDCLTAINEFLSLSTRQAVVCSRIEEYDALSTKLNVHHAIEMHPLTKTQVRNLLEEYIPSKDTVDTMLNILQSSDEIWQETNKPLFINILIATYRDGKPFIAQQTEDATQKVIYKQIIQPYIARQLQNSVPPKGITNELTERYLAWISINLKERKLLQFYVEMIQFDWMPHKNSSESTIITKFNEFNYNFYKVRFSNINLERKFQFNRKTFRKRLLDVQKSNALINFTMLIFVIYALIYIEEIAGLSVFLSLGVTAITAAWIGQIFLDSFSDSSHVSQRTKINQGLSETFEFWISLSFLTSLVALIFSLFSRLIFDINQSNALLIISAGTALGTFWILVTNYTVGLDDIFKHVTIRMILKVINLSPVRYDKLVLYAVKIRIMRQVGGSVIFIHRYIQEYFANEWIEKYQPEYGELPPLNTKDTPDTDASSENPV